MSNTLNTYLRRETAELLMTLQDVLPASYIEQVGKELIEEARTGAPHSLNPAAGNQKEQQ